MNKVITYILLSYMSLYATSIDERKIDIYFGNGVWNKEYTNDCESDSAANCSQFELNAIVQRKIIQGDSALQQKYGSVKLQYNWGEGYIDDILETYYQLAEAGQVNGIEFFTLMTLLFNGDPIPGMVTSILYEMRESTIASVEETNVLKMAEKYYEESLQYSHRVLLVSHSQGNLFANRISKDFMQETGYDPYFANLQVASPANEIKASKGDYVTAAIDPIINPIPGSMFPNTAIMVPGHSFVGAYLENEWPLEKIIEKTKALLSSLDQTHSQWKVESENEFTKECQERRATLVHNFDGGFEQLNKVYPFDTESVTIDGEELFVGKVYPAPDANGTDRYVLASSNGINIIDVEDQGAIFDDAGNDVGCYQLDGTDDQIVKGCGDANATEGVLEVDLSWKSPDINLTLSVIKDEVEVGDLDNIEKCPKRHWYIATEADVKEGTYFVHINAEDVANIDAALLTETLKLKIDAPGGGLRISIPIPSADLLDIGAVAKIIITKPEGGSGIGVAVEVTEHPDLEYTGERYQYDDNGKAYNYEAVSLLNIVEFGPIANAQIEIMSLVATDFGQIVYNGYTSSGDTLDTNGLMLLPSSFKQSVASDGLYLISATGGEDVDSDDDLNMDGTPTSNFGTIHAIVSGADIKENGLKVNILTELGYQVSKELLLNAEDALGVPSKLDEAAQALLNRDMNNDSTIDRHDFQSWVPSFDKDALRFNYKSKIHPIVLKIYNADDIYDDAYNLIYPNIRPVADAGEDVMLNFGESVILDGSGSYDSDGQIVEYIWSENGTPYCSGETPVCRLDGLTVGSYTFELSVIDNNGAIAKDSVKVSVIGEVSVIGGFNTTGHSVNVNLSTDGSIAYVADTHKGLQIIDISNPSMPSLIGNYDTYYALKVCVSTDNKFAYVADSSGGLLVIDISNPSTPSLVTSYTTPDNALDVSLSKDNTIAYVTSGRGGLQIFDINDPKMPKLIGTYNVPLAARSVTLSADGNIAYMTDDSNVLLILDISNPVVPILIGSCDLPDYSMSVTVSADGNTVYIPSSYKGLQVIDVSNPTVPSLLGNYDTLGDARNVTLSKDEYTAYVSDTYGGLQMIDISTPETPSLISSYNTSGLEWDVAISEDGTIAYIADGNSGLQIIDISALAR